MDDNGNDILRHHSRSYSDKDAFKMDGNRITRIDGVHNTERCVSSHFMCCNITYISCYKFFRALDTGEYFKSWERIFPSPEIHSRREYVFFLRQEARAKTSLANWFLYRVIRLFQRCNTAVYWHFTLTIIT